MRKLVLALALIASLSVNAQVNGYREYCDEVYLNSKNADCIDKYDEVEEVCDEVVNKLVIHNVVKNVYHVNGRVEENHYTLSGRPVGYIGRVPRPIRHYSQRAVVIPTRSRVSYEPVQTFDNIQYNSVSECCDNKWVFFFQINSDYLTNKEELGHLIDYAKSNPSSVFYIDAYADIETGGYDTNLRISKMRANAVIGFLIREGVNKNRLFVNYHGSTDQPYRTNNLNRCVTVSTSIK